METAIGKGIITGLNLLGLIFLICVLWEIDKTLFLIYKQLKKRNEKDGIQ